MIIPVNPKNEPMKFKITEEAIYLYDWKGITPGVYDLTGFYWDENTGIIQCIISGTNNEGSFFGDSDKLWKLRTNRDKR